MTKYPPVFFLTLLLSVSKLISQELPKIAPLSPETSNLAKFAEVPVSYYTGVPNISIPITTLNGRSISIPVSISYHAGGNKVTDVASWLGLGWNLNAGGQIYRVMNQLPDDISTEAGYLTTPRTLEWFEELNDPEDRNYWVNQAIQYNKADFAPDEFHFNFLGHSGKFMFNQNRSTNPYGEMVFFPQSDVKVVPVFNGSKIVEWVITTTDGNTFYFGENGAYDEIDSTISYSADNSGNLPAEGVAPYTSFSYVTAWKLTKIITNKNDVITFNYASHNYTQCTPTGESDVMSWSGSMFKSSSKTSGSNSVLSEIVSATGKIIFNKEVNPRQDLGYDYALDNIILKDKFDNQIQKIDFIHGYFQSTVPLGQTFLLCTSDESNEEISKRLKLDKVKFYGDSTSTSYEYVMEYNMDVILPHRLSKSQDYWGYFNGATNSTLVPTSFYREAQQPAIQNDFFYQGANRTINPNYTQANILKRILYPEGGKTEFEYENNTASGNFQYQNSLNIFEPNVENSVYINTRIDATSSSQKVISKPFTIGSPFEFQGRLRANSESSIFDNNPNNNGGDFGGNLPIANQDIRFYIKDASTGNIIGHSYGVPIGYDPIMYLNPGNYILEIVIGQNTNVNPREEDIIVDLKWNTRIYDHKLIGGLRIKSIKDYISSSSSIPAMVRAYDYKDLVNGDESGWIVSVPIFKEAIFVAGLGGNQMPKTKISSNNLYPLITTQNNFVGYTNVVESRVSSDEQLKNSFSFSFIPPASSFYGAPMTYEWESGNLWKSISYTKKPNVGPIFPDPLPFMYNYIPLKKTSKAYQYNFLELDRKKVRGLDIYQKAYNYGSLGLLKEIYSVENGTLLETATSHEDLFYDDDYNYQHSITTATDFVYGNPFIHLNPLTKETTVSTGETMREEYLYAQDITGPSSEIQTLIDQNRTAEPITVKSYIIDGANAPELLTSLNTVYENWNANDLVLPEIIQTAKGSSGLSDRIIYHDYDDYGNPLEVSKADGTHISYIWGYQQSRPIAKIENATYAQVQGYVSNLQTLSNADNDRTLGYNGNEGDLREALDALRTSFPNAMISTYTYDPLVGVTSMTDAKGYTMYYEYDGFHRFKQVKDTDGNILSKNEYNYATQN